MHLLVFSSITVITRHFKADKRSINPDAPDEGNINWAYLKYAFSIIIIPKLIGVFWLNHLAYRYYERNDFCYC